MYPQILSYQQIFIIYFKCTIICRWMARKPGPGNLRRVVHTMVHHLFFLFVFSFFFFYKMHIKISLFRIHMEKRNLRRKKEDEKKK